MVDDSALTNYMVAAKPPAATSCFTTFTWLRMMGLRMAMVGVVFGMITTRWTKNFMLMGQYPLKDSLGDRRKAIGFSLIGKSM